MSVLNAQLLVPVDSHETHPNMFKTLNLLCLDTVSGPVYFVFKGCAIFAPDDELQAGRRFFFEEHTCPTNFLRCELVSSNGNTDPHGLFKFVRTAWMPADYDEDDEEAIVKIFPEITTQPQGPNN